MDNKNEAVRQDADVTDRLDAGARHDARKDWETPELVVEDVARLTQGGKLNSKPSGDDAWYQS